MTLRFFDLPEHRVLIIRFLGRLAPDWLAEIRATYDKTPITVTYDVILDARRAAVAISDADLKDHWLKVRQFREQNGLAQDVPPKAVFLAKPDMGAPAVAKQFESLRGASVMVAYTPQDAWRHLVPHVPLPKTAERFLKAW